MSRALHSLPLACLLIAAHVSSPAAPDPIVELRFEEGSGLATANTGTLGGSADFAQREDLPVFSTHVPAGSLAPAANEASVDFGTIAADEGGRAIDLTTATDGTLGALNAFTICGWLNARQLAEGFGGNRIAFALASPNGPGFDLVQLASGALRIGINQWPDAGSPGGPRSSPGRITADPDAGPGNWVFFAVTYDPALPDATLRYYFGSPSQLASLDSEHTYRGGFDNGGLIELTGQLAVGNFGFVVGARDELGPGGGSRVFRGLMDEIRIHDVALSLDDIHRAQLNGEPPPAPLTLDDPPDPATAFDGESVRFEVQVSGSTPITYRWQRNESDITGATESSYVIPAVTAADVGALFRVIASNPLNSVTSAPVSVVVIPEDNHKVSVSFSESIGNTTTNSGNLGGTGGFVRRQEFPIFSTDVPVGLLVPPNNIASVDFGSIDEGEGGRGIDFTNAFGNTLRSMKAFTLSGWLNSRDLREGFGGNRIAFALASPNGPGFDLVQLATGALRLGVNQWPDGADGGGPRSSDGWITEDPAAGPGNWVFFAVTYDPALPSGNVKYYFGSPTQEAVLDIEADYNRGEILTSGPLTVGNFSSLVAARNESGPNGGSRVFRGLMDELNIFNRAFDLSEIKELQQAPSHQPPSEPPAITMAPASQTVFEGQSVTFSAEFTGTPPLTYQWLRDGNPIAGATEASHTLTSPAVSDSGAGFELVISNALGAVTSAPPAVLTVLPENNLKVYLPFEEGSGETTRNLGNLGGSATFSTTDGAPVFSTEVPSGPFAPASNEGSVDFGAIEEGQGGRAIDLVPEIGGTMGSMNAFTISGWVNSRDLRVGFGGNRIAFALASPNGPGFDLVHLITGALRLGVNQWPDGADGGGPQSSDGWLREDPETGPDNWIFFAVTYDSTLPAGHVKYYFGSGSQAAILDIEADYTRGPIESSGPLAVGNFSPVASARNETGPSGGSRVFRGLIDELRVFNRALDLAEIAAVQMEAVPTAAPEIDIALEGGEAVLSWATAPGLILQSRNTFGTGTWETAPETPTPDGQQSTVRIPMTGTSRFFRLSTTP
jgi:hypothetical protein